MEVHHETTVFLYAKVSSKDCDYIFALRNTILFLT